MLLYILGWVLNQTEFFVTGIRIVRYGSNSCVLVEGVDGCEDVSHLGV
jgi:hypothetical protein